MSMTGGGNPDVIKTAIDGIVLSELSRQNLEGYSTAADPMVFKQDTTDRGAVILDNAHAGGVWTSGTESSAANEHNPRVAQQKTHTVVDFKGELRISKDMFDDNQHGTVARMVEKWGQNARRAMDKNAFGLFRDSFGTATTADSVSIFNDAHTTVSGRSVDNLLTATLSESSLNTLITGLHEQLDQFGEIGGYMPQTLLVPIALYKTAAILLDTELRPGTANNDVNVYSRRYPGLTLRTSEWLGAAAGGSDTAYFLLGDGHEATRWVRSGLETALLPWQNTDNFDYKYKGLFREVVGANTYEGLIASNGTV